MRQEKFLKEVLKIYFHNKKTPYDSEIEKVLNESSDLDKKIIKERFTGGNAIIASFKFFISERTYYYKLQKFVEKLKIAVLEKKLII